MNQNNQFPFLSAAFILTLFASVFSQEPNPSATPPDDTVRVRTEEVRLNVMAQTANREFVSTLKPNDLLIVDEGDPQKITSMRRLPANILFLLDAGGDLNLVKSTPLTKIIAMLAIGNLAAEDSFSVIGYNDKVELISDWTSDRESVYARIESKLFSSKRERLAEAIEGAVQMFGRRPLENRHLVIVSDGIDSFAGPPTVRRAMDILLAANVTVHVISYTALEEQAAKRSSERFSLGKGNTKPRVSEEQFEEMLRGMGAPLKPDEAARYRAFLRSMNTSQHLVTMDLDNARIKTLRNKRAAVAEAEGELEIVAEETGGMFQAPQEVDTLLKFAIEVAHAIDSQYVVTYNPTKPIDLSRTPVRKIRVSSHCDGVVIRSRQKLAVTN